MSFLKFNMLIRITLICIVVAGITSAEDEQGFTNKQFLEAQFLDIKDAVKISNHANKTYHTDEVRSCQCGGHFEKSLIRHYTPKTKCRLQEKNGIMSPRCLVKRWLAIGSI